MTSPTAPTTVRTAVPSALPRTRPLPLLRRALEESWRSLLGWTIGLLAALLLYLPLFPTLGANQQMQNLINELPPQLVNTLGYHNILSGPGYVQATFYGLFGFVLLSIAATAWGTAAIAGDEETGSLELTLAHGVARVQLVLERTGAVVIRLLWLCAFSAIVVFALTGPAQLEIVPRNLIAGAAAMLGLALVPALFAVAAGAATGRRVYATGAGAGAAVVAYALNALGSQTADLAYLKDWSPYGWAYRNTPLVDGTDWAGLGLLFGLDALMLVVAVISFRARDIH